MADQIAKKEAGKSKAVAADLWSEISYFAWQRRPDAIHPPSLANQVFARTS